MKKSPFIIFILSAICLYSQQKKEYKINKVIVKGTFLANPQAVKNITGLQENKLISSDSKMIEDAIKKLWRIGIFSDIKIYSQDETDTSLTLVIEVKEEKRLDSIKISGLRKSQIEDLQPKFDPYRGKFVSEAIIKSFKSIIEDYLEEKGFLNSQVLIEEMPSPKHGYVILNIDVQKGKKVKIENIKISGNNNIPTYKILGAMEETKRRAYFNPFNGLHMAIINGIKLIPQKGLNGIISSLFDHLRENARPNIFKGSKFKKEQYKKDKEKIIALYKREGFRDASIVKDTFYFIDSSLVTIEIEINEGKRYFIRNVQWENAHLYTPEQLTQALGLKKGDVYNEEKINQRLYFSTDGTDIASLFMDKGYLFFKITPMEKIIPPDSVDLIFKIDEGEPAYIRNVRVVGNTRTSDKVIYREIRTRPGYLFNRSEIVRSQRELAQLGYFDPEKMNVVPIPDPITATVDLEYQLEEKPSDQIEFSGGWGGRSVVFMLRLALNNFSARKIFKKGGWNPIPQGDGQRLIIGAQTSGKSYQGYNFSFTEPWLGGKKPNQFTFSTYHTRLSNGLPSSDPKFQLNTITGSSITLGKRLTFPDDYFSIFYELTYQYFFVKNYYSFIFTDGFSHNFYGKATLMRNSLDQPLYPRSGSVFKLSIQATPPYFLFLKYPQEMTIQEKYKYAQYYKWKATFQWFTRIIENLVFSVRGGFGYLKEYSPKYGPVPFERFYLGGSGLSGFSLEGREIIALRGYPDGGLSPSYGATSLFKMSAELRYPFSLNPTATIYGILFADLGNSWVDYQDINPFDMRKGIGVGIRFFLPMFGLLGFDVGYRFDTSPYMYFSPKQTEVHFTIGLEMGEL